MPLTQLTPQQDALVSVYAQKWQDAARSTKPLNRPRAIAAVRNLYRSLGKPEPRVWIFDSPRTLRTELRSRSPAALAQTLGAPLLFPIALDLYQQVTAQLDLPLRQDLHSRLNTLELAQQVADTLNLVWQAQARQMTAADRDRLAQLQPRLRDRLLEQLWDDRERDWRSQVRQVPGGDWMLQWGDAAQALAWQTVGEPLWDTLGEPLWEQAIAPLLAEFDRFPPVREWRETVLEPLSLTVDGLGMGTMSVRPSLELSYLPVLDFAVSALGCAPMSPQWTAVLNYASDCGWAFPFQHACLLIDRPQTWTWDERDRLHGEGKPALRFADRTGVYAYSGVLLPERYAAVRPQLWKSQWLLEEPDADLRQVLLQGIGYPRLLRELRVRELDRWREYTLICLESDRAGNVASEPVYLLQIASPDTGYIHIAPVPTSVRSAQEAIRWAGG